MTVQWICGEFAQEPRVLIVSTPMKCERGGNGGTYSRAFWLAPSPGLPLFFEAVYALERGHGHFDLPPALPAEVGDVVPPAHQLEARQEGREVHGGKSYHSLWLWGRRIKNTQTVIAIVFRNAKTQPSKHGLEIGPRPRTIPSNIWIIWVMFRWKCSCRTVKAQGRERDWQGNHLYTQYTVCFWSKNQTAELQYIKKKEVKVFGYSWLATLQPPVATTNSMWRKQFGIPFSRKTQPLKHSQNKTREYGWTKPCKMINVDKEDAKGQEINKYLCLALF